MAVTSEMESSKLRVKCDWGDCTKHFENEKAMKRHKKDDPDHHYCRRCDVNCADWEDLTKHKVAMMAPWLDARHTYSKGESPAHIVCEFCGADFKSFGGRKLHREQLHPAEQTIYCPGGEECSCIFASASQLLEHFENNECHSIPYEVYLNSMTFKHVVGQIMKDPHEYQKGCHVNHDFALPSPTPGLIGSDHSTDRASDDGEDGGISILDVDHESQKRNGHQPLRPGTSNASSQERGTQVRAKMESWPKLPGTQMVSDFRKISIGSSTPSVPPMLASEYAKSIVSAAKSQVYTESFPPLSPAPTLVPYGDDDDSDAGSDHTVTASVALQRPQAWTTNQTSRALFGEADLSSTVGSQRSRSTSKASSVVSCNPPSNSGVSSTRKSDTLEYPVTKHNRHVTVTKSTTAPSTDGSYWIGLLNQRQEQASKRGDNLLYKRFWDPSHADYDAKRFLSDEIGKYCCPFGGCDAVYDESYDLGEHFRDSHMAKEFRCPHCLKTFKKGSSLMAHAEAAGGKCRVKATDGFDKLLDIISGGFLTAKQIRQPKILNTESALVKDGDVVNGVMTIKFEGQQTNSYQ